MVKKEKQATDYSKLSLPDVIKRKTKRKVTFFELSHDEQRGVLDYIQSHNIDIKVFGCKWYDILSGKFFTIEYLPREDSLFVDTNGPQDQIISKTGRAISARVAKWEDNDDALRFG